MKQDGENASDGLHSSKRLRLSTLRSQNRGRFRGLSDSAGPSHGASTSSSDVNLPSVSYRGVQVGTTADVRESSIEAGMPLSTKIFSSVLMYREFGRRKCALASKILN